MILIGIGNKARQGKDTAASFICEHFVDWNGAIYPFAKALKYYCKEHHEELVTQWRLKHQTKSLYPVQKDDPIYGFTEILQDTGASMRDLDPLFWVNKNFQHIELEDREIALVPDVRYKNEAQFIKDRGGILIQVIRINNDGTQFIDPNRDPNHPSEIELDDYLGWDFIIRAKNVDQLYMKMRGLCNDFIAPQLDNDATGLA